MKDNFSFKSHNYRRFRPQYPDTVFAFIREKLKGFSAAWDCGTGNGQVAGKLAEYIDRIEATDISENQIKNAVKKKNIHYSIQPAEQTSFAENTFDLVICGQSFHWFDFDRFYQEVQRCLKPDGIIVIMGYGLFKSNAETNKVIHKFYTEIIGPYWDPERKYLDENYQTIPFPFTEVTSPEFIQEYQWELSHLLGYLRTWSAVKHYEKAVGEDPVDLIADDLQKSFGKNNKVVFPILFRMGKNDQD